MLVPRNANHRGEKLKVSIIVRDEKSIQARRNRLGHTLACLQVSEAIVGNFRNSSSAHGVIQSMPNRSGRLVLGQRVKWARNDIEVTSHDDKVGVALKLTQFLKQLLFGNIVTVPVVQVDIDDAKRVPKHCTRDINFVERVEGDALDAANTILRLNNAKILLKALGHPNICAS
jgi:hypothetical protein